ncbi:Holliday junction branch migration protein RuvA [Lewinella cohaerens]|uniref:Holliday junction branch migration protein RuvA n=1 Tax=Lewinella cohaerens TaxID=70995 RepID=UPI00035F4FF5|nr:Holliday junction branch migration protein RuvA [Lewinella cohaerens]
MITYVKGTIAFKNPTFIVVEAGGIGYHINISLHTYAQIEKAEQVRILTHLQVKEDSHTLYGFAEDSERNFFRMLISVSGVGPATAQIALSSLTPDELRAAIIGEDVNTFKGVKGIGPKTAKRIILDLKDKVLKDSGESVILSTPKDNTLREEALSALVALGFSRPQVQRTLNRILRESPVDSAEQLIKQALRDLSS